MSTAGDIAVWQRTISASWDALPPETAAGIPKLAFSDRDVKRMAELSERSSALPLAPRE